LDFFFEHGVVDLYFKYLRTTSMSSWPALAWSDVGLKPSTIAANTPLALHVSIDTTPK